MAGFERSEMDTTRSGVIQTSAGLNWPSILTIRSEMAFRKKGVSTIKMSRMNMAERRKNDQPIILDLWIFTPLKGVLNHRPLDPNHFETETAFQGKQENLNLVTCVLNDGFPKLNKKELLFQTRIVSTVQVL